MIACQHWGLSRWGWGWRWIWDFSRFCIGWQWGDVLPPRIPLLQRRTAVHETFRRTKIEHTMVEAEHMMLVGGLASAFFAAACNAAVERCRSTRQCCWTHHNGTVIRYLRASWPVLWLPHERARPCTLHSVGIALGLALTQEIAPRTKASTRCDELIQVNHTSERHFSSTATCITMQLSSQA